MRARAILVAAVAVSVAGCDNLNAIHRADSLDGGVSVTTDAKQRMVINLPADDDDMRHNNPKRFVCAEPSPDVAQAVSEALRASLTASLEKTAAQTGKDQAVSAEFARSLTADVVQLGERLATIQLLRDKMYRACEAFANGMLNVSSYQLMMARLDKTMVTLLSNEMAAGAFGRALARAGGSATVGGVPLAEIAKQEGVVKEKAEALRDAPSADRPGKFDALGKEIETLAAMQRLSAGVGAASGTTPLPGQIGSRQSFQPDAIAAIHQRYTDDDGIEPLIDSCITSLYDMKNGDEGKAQVTSENLKQLTAEAVFKSGTLLASICYDKILHPKFIEERQTAKYNLRKLDNDREAIRAGLQKQKLDLCAKVMASDISNDQKAEFLKSCS